LYETLSVINEHITDLSSPQGNGGLRAANDSGSEYSSHIDHRLSYIQGEETDEEEERTHTRTEVENWSADEVAEYLFTAGVEKHHCEVFRDQEITGEVLLGMDQTSLFIKAFDLGPVGRRLKTWQRIKALQDEVDGSGSGRRRTTQNYGSEAGSDAARSVWSRTNTMTSSIHRLPPLEDHSKSIHAKRLSLTQTPKVEPTQSPILPTSPTSLADSPSMDPYHEKRPSAASIRELRHSRRHSSADFRLSGPNLNTATSPKPVSGGSFPTPEVAHRKQPSFDRNWTLGGAAASAYSAWPLSSGSSQDVTTALDPDAQTSTIDLDRGYFSGTEVDGRRRNVLKKRDTTQSGQHSRKSSYVNEQRVRSATALSQHSRLNSLDLMNSIGVATSPAAQKYYGLTPGSHKRNSSVATTDSIRAVPPVPPVPGTKEAPYPIVTKLDADLSNSVQSSAISPISPLNRQAMHAESSQKAGLKMNLGLRAISDAVTGSEKLKISSPIDSHFKDSPMQSPSRTGSSTPSVGPSFDLDSPDAAKSPSTAATAVSRRSRKKSKKETSAYLRGLRNVAPREAIADADYSGWMKKKNSNLMTTWKSRLFVLKGKRLAYYYSEDDDQEKGLIDISFHRVLPADNEKLTGLHATLTGASATPITPAGSNMPTLAATEAKADPTNEADSIFIFKLVPPRTGLSRAINFTKPTVHYFAVPNIKEGRLWMAALMRATIDRDDTQPITTTYKQKTISLSKARQMRHRPPALMNLEETGEDIASTETNDAEKQDANGLGIVYNENDSGIAGLEKLGLQKVDSNRSRGFTFGTPETNTSLPQSA
jgi:hypothetical protein